MKADKQRLQAWVPTELKAQVDTLLEEEAMSFTELITQLLRERVRTRHQELKERFIIELNKEDTLRLIDTLENPPEPSPELKKLKADYEAWEKGLYNQNNQLDYDFRSIRKTRQEQT